MVQMFDLRRQTGWKVTEDAGARKQLLRAPLSRTVLFLSLLLLAMTKGALSFLVSYSIATSPCLQSHPCSCSRSCSFDLESLPSVLPELGSMCLSQTGHPTAPPGGEIYRQEACPVPAPLIGVSPGPADALPGREGAWPFRGTVSLSASSAWRMGPGYVLSLLRGLGRLPAQSSLLLLAPKWRN